jgi:hypothetical protein
MRSLITEGLINYFEREIVLGSYSGCGGGSPARRRFLCGVYLST